MLNTRLFFIACVMGYLLPFAAMAQVCTHPDQPFSPIMETHKMPPYPQISQMTGEQGKTRLKVTIGEDGAASDAQVMLSSGSLRLDAAAQDFVKTTWRWNSAIKDCKPVTSTTEIDIVWDLRNATENPGLLTVAMKPADYPPDALARHEEGIAVVVLFLSDKNVVLNALIARSSGFPDLDAKALELARTRYHWTAARLEGKTVPTTVFMGMAWTLSDGTPLSH